MATREITRYWLEACLGLGLVAMAPAQETGIKGPIPKEDIRVVNGRVVDVAPVHGWLQTREGERPLPHWQSFQILEIKRVVAGLHHCVAKQEDGEMVEIMVARITPEVRDFCERLAKLKRQIEMRRVALDRERRRLEELDAVAPVAAGGPAWYVERTMGQRKKVNLDMVRLQHAFEDLQKLEESLQSMSREAPQNARIIAFRAGQYAGLAVWDCGASKKQPRL